MWPVGRRGLDKEPLPPHVPWTPPTYLFPAILGISLAREAEGLGCGIAGLVQRGRKVTGRLPNGDVAKWKMDRRRAGLITTSWRSIDQGSLRRGPRCLSPRTGPADRRGARGGELLAGGCGTLYEESVPLFASFRNLEIISSRFIRSSGKKVVAAWSSLTSRSWDLAAVCRDTPPTRSGSFDDVSCK